MEINKKLKDWTKEDFVRWANEGGGDVNGTTAQIIANRAIRNEYAQEGSIEEVLSSLKDKEKDDDQDDDQEDLGAVEGDIVIDKADAEEVAATEQAAEEQLAQETAEAATPAVATEVTAEEISEQTQEVAAVGETILAAKVSDQVAEGTLTSAEQRRASAAAAISAVTVTGPGEADKPEVPAAPVGRKMLPKVNRTLDTETFVDHELAAYLTNMSPQKQIDPSKLVLEQLRLWNVIQRIFNSRGGEFVRLYTKLLKVVASHSGTGQHFHELKAYRGFNLLSHRMTQRDHTNFRRALNMILVTADPSTRVLASRQCDIPSALADFPDDLKSLVTDYYRGV